MDDKNKSKMTRTVTENLSRDFLTRFMGNGWREGEFGDKKDEVYVDEEEEKIELNLGLSLGGQFGVEKGSKKLIRSSSIAECFPVKDENDALTFSSPPVAYSRLIRTTSLPLETEEWRKRKEMQSLRRMEAKRRRSEKQRNVKGDKDEGSSGVAAQMQEEKKEVIDLNLRGRIEKEKLLAAAKQIDSRVTLRFGTSDWDVFGRGSVQGGNGIGVAIAKGKGMHEFGQLISQGSIESQGGSSSSDLDNRSHPGSGSNGDASPADNHDVGSSGTKTNGSLCRTSSLEVKNPSDMTRSQVKEAKTTALEDMPCVFTTGDGPNGRRVDGILYQYGKGEEVRIMCVCHGNFHSPAEFVRHAGGTDMTHPLRHIVVNPNPTPFM